MTYIRKYDYVDSTTFTHLYAIIFWQEPFDNLVGCWYYISQFTYIFESDRDLMFNSCIRDGLICDTIFGCNASIYELEPPNETDIQIDVCWV